MDIDQLECILFDFGNTLADENFFRKSTEAIENFAQIADEFLYRPYYKDPFGENLLNQWMVGKIDKNFIADHIGNKIHKKPRYVLEAMKIGCENLILFESIFSWAREISKTKKVAIVTINADIFNDYIDMIYKNKQKEFLI